MGFNVWAVTTNDSSNVYDQNQFDYAWAYLRCFTGTTPWVGVSMITCP